MEAQSKARMSQAARAVEPSQVSRDGLAFILATIFLDMLGAAIRIPVQAYIVRLYNTDALIGAGNAFMRPTLTALISNGVSFREQGKVAGVTASLTSLTFVLGPLWAGLSL